MGAPHGGGLRVARVPPMRDEVMAHSVIFGSFFATQAEKEQIIQ
jgi:hypothetical protein